jgi:hypothetical protein
MKDKLKNIVKGVYTVTCGKCGHLNIVHVDGEDHFDPKYCLSCKIGFMGIEKGTRNNQYIGLAVEEDPVLEEENESEEEVKNKNQETKKIGKKSSGNQSFTLKKSKKSSENQIGKKSSFRW